MADTLASIGSTASQYSGAIQAGASLASAGAGLIASSNASDAATQAAQIQAQSAAAAQTQQASTTSQTRNDLAPYNGLGQQAGAMLGNNLSGYSQPNNGYLDQAQTYQGLQSGYAANAQAQFDQAAQIGSGPNGQAMLAATPGYQFSLQQGLMAAQNSAAARGLGVSGAAMKGAATYATGLADNTYQQQYANAVQNAQNTQSTANQYGNLSTSALNTNSGYQGNLTNSYNKLLGTAGLGESAAAQTGTLAQAGATNQTGLITGAGNALASGTVGSANALSTGVTNAGNTLTSAATLNSLLNQQNANTNASNSSTYYNNNSASV